MPKKYDLLFGSEKVFKLLVEMVNETLSFYWFEGQKLIGISFLFSS